MKKYIPLLILCSVFFLIKINGVGIRLSDSNIYFYTAYQLIDGKLLYKDIFFTNFPLLPYISVLYYLVSGGNLFFYYITPILEALGVSIIIYHIVYQLHKHILLSTISSAVYLFSFIVLATSDHQSGVFLASFFGVLGYYFLLHKKIGRSGIGIGLSLLTKAYFLPLAIACIAEIISTRKKSLVLFLGAAGITVLIVLLPSLLLARNELYHNIIEYSLTRSQGISKIHILRFFTIHDLLLVCVFFYTLFRIRKNIFMGTLSITSIIFILLYKDIYYLYLNFLVPFLSIAFSDMYLSLEKRMKLQKMILPTLLVILFLVNSIVYLSSYQSLQRVEHIDEIVSFLKNQPETQLYGTNDSTPALAYLSQKKLLNGIVDTNENIFRKGFLDASDLTKDAINTDTLIITHGAYYPQFNIQDPLIGGIFDRELMMKSCVLLMSYPVRTEGIENQLNMFRC